MSKRTAKSSYSSRSKKSSRRKKERPITPGRARKGKRPRGLPKEAVSSTSPKKKKRSQGRRKGGGLQKGKRENSEGTLSRKGMKRGGASPRTFSMGHTTE